MVSRTRPARAVIVPIWMSDHLRPLLRNAVDVLPQGALEKRLSEAAAAKRPLRIKLGLDPTAVSVTLGWSVVLSKLSLIHISEPTRPY